VKQEDRIRLELAESGEYPPESTSEPRLLHEIASDIFTHWTKIYFGAKPYLYAMLNLDKITDRYGQEGADDIVRYFLTNAQTWRGEHARRIKAELKEMLK
jgi:hypothetical protein